MKFRDIPADVFYSRHLAHIFTLLDKSDGLLSSREISRLSKIPHTTVLRVLRKLHQLNVAWPVRVGKSLIYRINRGSYAFPMFSSICAAIWDHCAPIEKLEEIVTKYSRDNRHIKKVFLFGSIAKGEEKYNSDIDLFFVTDNQKLISTNVGDISKACSVCFGNTVIPYYSRREGSLVDGGVLLYEPSAGGSND